MDLQHKIKLLIKLLAIIVFSVGTLNLFGWYFQVKQLTEFIPGYTPMMFNTGLCFAIFGLALFLLTLNQQWSVRCLSLIPICIGGLTLFEYFFGINLNIDNLLFNTPPHPLVYHTGRMAPNTALCFILAALCLIFIASYNKNLRNWIASSISAIIFSLGAISLLGYFFLIPMVSTNSICYYSTETLMAYHTALSLLILGSGIYLATLTYTNEGKISSWAIVPLALAVLSIQISLWNILIAKNKSLQHAGINISTELFILIALFSAATLLVLYLISRYIRLTVLLETAKIQMQSTSENRERLLHHVSHEIKNPLNAIMGFSTLLLEDKNEGEEKETLESIQSSAAHILNLTKDLLAITRLEGGNIELNEVEFKLHPWVDEVTSLTANRAKLKKISFTSHLDGRIPEVIIGDYSKIAQIIFNLTDNALKFTPHGKSIHFYLNYIPLSNNEFMFEIAVKDSGPGVPPEAKKRIFEPYSQLQTFQKGQGSGLGLSICTAYSKMMRGEIGVNNNEDGGATFYSRIRLRRSAPSK